MADSSTSSCVVRTARWWSIACSRCRMSPMNDLRGLVALALGVLGAAPAAAQPVPAEGRLDYAIMRSGDQVGTHTITFRREGDRVIVDIAVDAQVRVLGITAYRFNQRSSETWRNGRLLSLDSTGNNDGTAFSLRAREADGGLVVEAHGRSTRWP